MLCRTIVSLILIAELTPFAYGCKTGAAAIPDAAAPADRIAAAKTETAGSGRASTLHLPSADGTRSFSDKGITIDASHIECGYFMVKSEKSEQRLKLNVICGESAYTYDLPDDGRYITAPCQMGSGSYRIRVMENVGDNLYAQRYSVELDVQLIDENEVFLYPNPYVDFDGESAAVAKADALSENGSDEGDIADCIYRFVVQNTEYDYEKAATVQKGYLPDPDETLTSGKGICFDYAALLATMLRAEGIPAKLVIGSVMPEDTAHAWVSAYVDKAWKLMDATFDGMGHEDGDYTAERVY